MKRSGLFLLGLFLFGNLWVACSDDNNEGGGGEDGFPSYVADASEYDQWTYFDFETGKGRTLKVKGEEGGVTGIYYGKFDASVRGTSYESKDSVKMVITRISKDSVSIELCDLTLSMDEGAVEPYSLTANAKAEKRDNKWVLTGTENKCDVVNGEDITEWKVVFNGEIGTSKGKAVSLTGSLTPGNMPFPLSATYEGLVDNSKVYEVDGDEASFDWDLAFHKYDIRTNGGSAIKMSSTKLSDVIEIPSEGYEADTDSEVMVDMSQMMQGYVGYQSCKLNKVLKSWVTATPTGSMPPYTYELNSHVFLVKTKAGKYAKIKFTDTTNEKNKAVYAAFSYEYPAGK